MAANRRQFLMLGTGAALLANPMSKALGAACGLTPAQTSGPFYPGENHFHVENDLTQIPGHSRRAEGQIIFIQGRVLDEQCRPIPNATVEIWQACASGKYNNPRDPNPAPLDPNFKYWAETFTADSGGYSFKTILPGAYPADTNWTRPPHIHFKISALGYKELITQMYFKGNQFNDTDLILQDIAREEQDSVIVEFLPATADLELGALVGTFDITLKSVR